MNKNEYLNALKEALKDTDESILEEIVSDYEEHFQIGMEYGKSEEQICKELGSIEDLAQEIKEVYNADSKEDKKAEEEQSDTKNSKNKGWHSGIYYIDGEKIGDAINSALDTAGDAISKIDVNEIGRTVKSTIDQATSSINSFANSYFKNQEKDPFDPKWNTEGYTENVSKSYDDTVEPEEAQKDTVSYDTESAAEPSKEVPDDTAGKVNETVAAESSSSWDQQATVPEEIKNIDSPNDDVDFNLMIDGIHADVSVRKSSNGKINFNYVNNGNERQRQMYEFYSYKEGNTVYAGIRRVGKAVFFFNFKLYSTIINVEIPDDMNNVNIKTASGSIELSGVNADRIQAATASGDIEADNTEAKFLSLKSASGDIKARNITSDVIDANSLSGDVDTVNIKASECKVRSTSGDVDINDFSINNADVSSISGDIKISRVSGEGLRVSSTSGDISAEMNVKKCYLNSKSGDIDANCLGDLILESGSTSGDINVKLKNNNNGYNIKARTISGELYIDYDRMHQRDLKTGTYTHGNLGSELNLSSVSGDIHLYD